MFIVIDNMELCGIIFVDYRLVYFEIVWSMKEVLIVFEVDICGLLKEKEVLYFLLWIGKKD